MSFLPKHPRVALVGGLGVSTLFALWTALSKEVSALNVRQPWQDDPYDVLVSLDMVVIPVLVVAAMLRSLLCVHLPPAARRTADLLRTVGVALGACLVTQLGEWNAVLLGRHRATWNHSTTAQIAMLGVFSVLTVCAALLVYGASRVVGHAESLPAQPDWLADLVTLGGRVASVTNAMWLGSVVRWSDDHVVRQARRQPVVMAAVFSLLLSSPFIAAKVFVERYPTFLVLVVLAFVWACLFVVAIALGTYVNVVAELSDPSPSLCAILGGCVCGTVLFAFHDSLLGRQTVGGLAVLLAAGGVVGGAVSFAIATWRRRRPPTTPCYGRRVLRGSPGHRAERGLPPP